MGDVVDFEGMRMMNLAGCTSADTAKRIQRVNLERDLQDHRLDGLCLCPPDYAAIARKQAERILPAMNDKLKHERECFAARREGEREAAQRITSAIEAMFEQLDADLVACGRTDDANTVKRTAAARWAAKKAELFHD